MLTLMIDLLVLAAIVTGFIRGASRGFLFTLGSIIGSIVGAIAAFLLVPPLSALVPEPQWRIAVVFASIALLIGGGLSLGEALGQRWRRGVRKKLRGVDRGGGAIAGGVVAL
ncbi:MAG: CvpA family protein, partial [Microbacteriaceae bacterium]|nr:CvpA family protein [Microbacteriaceae bacterium]